MTDLDVNQPMTPSPNAIANRFVALWNAREAVTRERLANEFYAPDAEYVFYRRDPIHGLPAILDQMAYTHEIYDPMGYEFRSSHNAVGHHNIVRLGWVMVAIATGELEMTGQDFLVLSEDGLVKNDYQFHDRLPTSFQYNDGYEVGGVATRGAQPTRTRS